MSLSEQVPIVPKEVSEDNRLDYRSKGLLCVLIMKAGEWNGSLAKLVEFVTPRDEEGKVIRELKGEGKAAVRVCIQKLEKLGYLRRELRHDEKGKFSGYEYKVLIPPKPVAVTKQQKPSSD